MAKRQVAPGMGGLVNEQSHGSECSGPCCGPEAIAEHLRSISPRAMSFGAGGW